MIDGKILATQKSDEEGPLEVWGVWIPRKGDNLIFTMEVAKNYLTKVTAELFEKDYDEVGDGAFAGQSLEFDADEGRRSFTRLGAKEIVRIKLTVKRTDSLPERDVGWCLFRFLQPVWFEAVKV